MVADLGDDARWFNPAGYDSVALCIIDSIYSTGNHYSGVMNAIAKYQQRRAGEGGEPHADTASDLIAASERWGGVQGLSEATNKWRCWANHDAPLKAEAALCAAKILAAHNVEDIDDVRSHLDAPTQQDSSPIKRGWIQIPGHRSGLTWTYFLMLAGVPGVKADRMIVRYVERVLGQPVDSRTAAALVSEIADRRGLRRTKLDHAIWRYESGRNVYTDHELP